MTENTTTTKPQPGDIVKVSWTDKNNSNRTISTDNGIVLDPRDVYPRSFDAARSQFDDLVIVSAVWEYGDGVSEFERLIALPDEDREGNVIAVFAVGDEQVVWG